MFRLDGALNQNCRPDDPASARVGNAIEIRQMQLKDIADTMDPVAKITLIIAVLLFLGTFGEFVFERTRVPDLVWMVLAGIIAGPVLGIISPELLEPTIPFFGAIALTTSAS